MNKLTLVILLACSFSTARSQQDFFLLKKKDKTIAAFKKYSYIAFELQNRQWYTGYIEKVQHDTFYINPFILHYSMRGIDTVHYNMLQVALSDVFAMPKKGVQFGYHNEKANLTTKGGHVHWMWIKNGQIFRVAGAGYIILKLVNGLIQNNFSFSGSHLGIAAGVLLIGELLRRTYKLTLRLGKKYYLQSVQISK